MSVPRFTDDEFIKLWGQYHSATKVSEVSGMSVRRVCSRRRTLEGKLGITLAVNEVAPIINNHSSRVNFHIDNGVVVVFSDAHFWDTIPTTAYRGLLRFIKEIQPRIVVCNGDAFDGAGISRHPKIGFMETKPSVIQELNACNEMLSAIADAAHGAKLTWPLGNHDARFEAFLAARAPEYEMVKGFHLKDHFPEWTPCWATWINENTVIKHRYRGGIHATHNNTVGSGVNIVTGHLHSLKVTPWTDYNGTRYGVDTGTLAYPNGEQFIHYTEDNPKNWRSGFAVLTFHKGRLLPPETVEVLEEGLVAFRGKAYEV